MRKPGLRERKRNERRLEILESAAEIFRRKSFDVTKIEEIAAKADVATTTVYNYFPTKDALLLALADHYRTGLPDAMAEVVKDPGKRPIAAFVRLYTIWLRESMRYLDKALWRHAYAAMTVSGWNQQKHDRWEHEEMMIGYQCEIIEKFQKMGIVARGIDQLAIAEAIHSIGFFWFQRYLVQDSMSSKDYLARVQRGVKAVFDGKLTGRVA